MIKHMVMLLIMLLLLTGCSVEQEKIFMEDTKEMRAYTETTSTAETAKSEKSLPVSEPELLTVLVNPRDEDFVRVKDYIPGIITELKYASADNFTGQVIYQFEDVFLRYGTVMKLKAAAEELEKQGLFLKIWDGFRPVSAQFKLWDICPEPTYVANPSKGYSNHSRGFAVDLTLVDNQGRELEMPTAFDDFSAKADRDYRDCSNTAAQNAHLLESVMEKHGFSGYWGEWWHFNDTEKYEVETCFDPSVIGHKLTLSETELLNILSDDDDIILTIPEEQIVTLLGYKEEYAMVEYWGYRGFVPAERLQ